MHAAIYLFFDKNKAKAKAKAKVIAASVDNKGKKIKQVIINIMDVLSASGFAPTDSFFSTVQQRNQAGGGSVSQQVLPTYLNRLFKQFSFSFLGESQLTFSQFLCHIYPN